MFYAYRVLMLYAYFIVCILYAYYIALCIIDSCPGLSPALHLLQVGAGYRLPIPRHIPPVVARIMKACWHNNPEKRPSFLLISTLLTTKVTFENCTTDQ